MEAPGDGLQTVKPTRVYYLQARAVFIYLFIIVFDRIFFRVFISPYIYIIVVVSSLTYYRFCLIITEKNERVRMGCMKERVSRIISF